MKPTLEQLEEKAVQKSYKNGFNNPAFVDEADKLLFISGFLEAYDYFIGELAERHNFRPSMDALILKDIKDGEINK